MKATSIVRKVDNLGRIVLPVELRRSLDIDIKDPVEIFVEGDKIILKKYQIDCVFCKNTSNVVDFMDKKVCKKCIQKLNS